MFVNLVCMFTVISSCSSSGGVLKCRFYYYSSMVRPTDQEMIAAEKNSLFLTISKVRGACCATQGHMGKQLGWSGGSQSEGRTWARVSAVVSVGRKG